MGARPSGADDRALPNPPQTQIAEAFIAGATTLLLKQTAVLPPPHGWIRIGNQYARYANYSGNPLTGTWTITLGSPSVYPYACFTVADSDQ